MAIHYRVYANDLAGGPVDYGTPVYDGALLTWATAPLPFGSDARYAVRAYDTVTGYEERNLSATYRLVTGPAGENLSLSPPPVPAVAASPVGPGAMRVAWPDVAQRGSRAATGFRVYGGTPSVSYASPLATVAAVPGATSYSATLTGLTAGAPYQFAVRPYNANAEQADATPTVLRHASPAPPEAPEGGSSSASLFS